MQGSFDNQIPEEEEEVDYHQAPHQLAAYAIRGACLAAARHPTMLEAEKEYLSQREQAASRLRRSPSLKLPLLDPPAAWEGDTMYSAAPIRIQPTTLSP